MKTTRYGLMCSVVVLAVGCADRHEPDLVKPVSPIGPSYTTVPLMIEGGAGSAPAGGINTISDAGRAAAGSRGELLSALDGILDNWKEQPRDLARGLMVKYGSPHEVTQSRLIWYNSGPWKRIELLNAESPHNFPSPHHDMLRQFIDYKVPPEKVADVLAYNGSILIDRTRGEMAASCASEEMNTLALNLAHDVVTGQRTPEVAREFHTTTAAQHATGVSSPLIEKLQFVTAVGPTADADEPFRPAAERREPAP